MGIRDDRAHVRLPSDLKSFAVEYAKKNNMSFSDLIVMLLTKLEQAEARKS